MWGAGAAILTKCVCCSCYMGRHLSDEGYFSGLNKKKSLETLWKTVWILLGLEGWKCLSLQDSVGHHFWLHMCLNILWGRPSKHAETPTRFQRLSRDTNTFHSSPRETCLVLTSTAKTTLPGWQGRCRARPVLLVWEDQNTVWPWGASEGGAFSFGCRTRFLRQRRDSWALVLLVLFQPASAGSSSQISCIYPEQRKELF